MEIIRIFIAIELPEQIKSDLKKLQDSLKTGRQDWAKWVSPESIHLTLKFLGDVSSDKIDEIVMAMTEAATGIPPFSLRLEGLGTFPNLKRIKVIWVGLNGDLEPLKLLQKRIEENLVILGYPEEGRNFTPHLTLARVKIQPPPAEQQKFVQLLTASQFTGSQPINADTINLMKSQLTPRGAIYTRLRSVDLRTS